MSFQSYAAGRPSRSAAPVTVCWLAEFLLDCKQFFRRVSFDFLNAIYSAKDSVNAGIEIYRPVRQVDISVVISLELELVA